jgi:hypothetical protein
MTAAIIDYFNVLDSVDAERIFRGSKTGPDIDHLRQSITDHETGIKEWLESTFTVNEKEVDRVLSKFTEYITKIDQPVAPGIEDTAYWEFFGDMADRNNRGALQDIDDLIKQLGDQG